ncbi:mannan endo-1,4-beta-mannosidase 7 [Ricinus communis]|uniref:mannan endo-1,4-beta-mannosidase n=1 Tax=Ricinus communis TaxID=3988 RepID=B9R7X5_RICCO|nr:mannan endo-1,4-beta-mannosidase 7 [Ricinus communis]EEF52605.1 hydrolase, hydrolyzing O-glycosyl compounds, putative [Ricinus communis]|eukprot:XP_002510418.1 mannan endo-1,4-beta-mannosidase 7 [Ricinus communis]
MKYWGLVFLAILVFQKQGMFLQVKAADDGFVSTKGVQFMLNGSPFYANGFNAYWLMYFATDNSMRNKVSSVFQEARNHGLTLARTWAFNDGQDRALQYSPGSYNEQAFQGLDFVISEAKRNGIKLVLSLVNNYESFGGKKQYVNWARSQGQSISSDDDFFTNSVVKGYYKNHIKTVLTRRNSITGVAYKDEPTIMAWELMNEPRCTSDPSGKTIQTWITEMASYVKSIDSNHLLEAGLEGFYGQSSSEKQHYNPNFQIGTDFVANNQIPDIDFATVHSYPDQWLPSADDESQQSFLNDWLNNHIQDAQNILHKPVLFAEFGKSSRTAAYNQRDQLFNTVYWAIYSSARGGGAAAGGMFWQLFTGGMDSFRDGYEVVFNENPSTAGIIADQSQKLNKIRKMYARLRNIEKWNRARQIRTAQWWAGNNSNKIKN